MFARRADFWWELRFDRSDSALKFGWFFIFYCVSALKFCVWGDRLYVLFSGEHILHVDFLVFCTSIFGKLADLLRFHWVAWDSVHWYSKSYVWFLSLYSFILASLDWLQLLHQFSLKGNLLRKCACSYAAATNYWDISSLIWIRVLDVKAQLRFFDCLPVDLGLHLIV